jgi:Tol biopolymer transport system component
MYRTSRSKTHAFWATVTGVAAAALAAMALPPDWAIAQDGAAAEAQTTPSSGMLRYPDVSKTHIVFSYAGDLWIVARDGGVASPLASPRGSELFPRFNESGDTIAFVGNYEGDQDLYTISVDGGNAERVT